MLYRLTPDPQRYSNGLVPPFADDAGGWKIAEAVIIESRHPERRGPQLTLQQRHVLGHRFGR